MLMQHESSSQLLPVSLLRNSIRSRLVNLCDNHSNDDHNNDDKQDNEEAPPLLAVTATRLDDSTINFDVGSLDVVVDFLALLLNVGNERFLLLDDLVKVVWGAEFQSMGMPEAWMTNRVGMFMVSPRPMAVESQIWGTAAARSSPSPA